MHPILKLIFALLLCSQFGYAQTLKKYPIGESGCSAYFFCDPGRFPLSYSEDSSKMFNGECVHDEVTYGVIGVKLLEPVSELTNAEELMIAYLDYLKTAMHIRSSMGYGKGHQLRGREDTKGVIDYWKDEEQNNWKVKGWTNGKLIMVFYVYSKKELNENTVNPFLDGLLLPGM